MLSVQNLSKSFGSHTVLNNISFDVPQNQCVAIIGPSGSGKSTLLRCINHLEVPDSGSISFLGTTLSSQNIHALRPHIAMVFQHFNLFSNLSVLDNITYSPINVLNIPKNQAIQNALSLLDRVNLKHKANSFPHTLSGGQKQRVAIVRALATNPKILLLDEPTSALDPEMVKEVLSVIQSLVHSGLTILLNTHEMNFAQKVADRILFLDHGSILADSPPSSFFSNPPHPRIASFLQNIL